ncbi:TPA: hypothetical protein N0F65_002997 [Lagenidium giganteum]|uniref:Polyprotein n=1 Tax=Lagenidium giganteum TaxID=4803 RepID=A0AAV2YM47_9STRA|nr:TPA: hypothetical protein N0F65_002997 [Lagenidium giganteum]
MTEQADLYQFDAAPSPHHQAHVASTGKTKALELLHKRMGHANMRTRKDIPRHNSVLNFDSNAASCKVDYPLQKLHSDICGPLLVPSISGCRYFVVFIDDYSRFTVTYAMKSRSERYAFFEDFRLNAVNDVAVHAYDLWYGTTPSMQHLNVFEFGCATYAHIPEMHRGTHASVSTLASLTIRKAIA